MTRVIVSSKDSEEKIVEKAREKMRDDLSDYLSVENLDEIKNDSEMPYNEKDDYAKGGKTKNLPTKQEFREFQEYVFSFYGKDGIYGQTDYFEGGATTEEILLATNQYVTFCAKNPDLWGGGDSTDREIVRDIMQYHRGENVDGLEHGDYIKRMKKTTILEYGGILQPMIGGVNADPRFDIYNTTMFAEDGAMLELGGENPDEKLKVTIHVDVYEDDYEEGEGKNVNSYTVDWLKNPIVKADNLLEYLYDNLYLSRYAQDYTIDDDGFIHTSRLEDADGNKASESEIEKWKKGEMKLYSAHYLIIVEAVGQTRKPSQSELHDVTDIPMYEDGGEMAKGGEFTPTKEIYSGKFIKIKMPKIRDFKEEKIFARYDKEDFIFKIYDEDKKRVLRRMGALDFENNLMNGSYVIEGYMTDGGKTMSRKVLTRRYLQGRAKNIFTFGYGMPKDAIDMYGTKGGSEYFVMPNGDVYKKTTADMHKFELIDVKDKS
jgi:hypothetical protein